MIVHKKEFYIGIVLFVVFLAIFAYMWTPSFNNMNAFDYADNLFNELSKASCYQIPDLINQAEEKTGTELNATVKADDPEQAQTIAAMFDRIGAKAEVTEEVKVNISGDYGLITKAILQDSDQGFSNNAAYFENKYGLDAKEALYTWWLSLDKIYKDLQARGEFEASKFINDVKVKGPEPGYNYFGIEGRPISEATGIATFAMVFYIFYTVLLGYAIYFLFEGVGILASGKKAS